MRGHLAQNKAVQAPEVWLVELLFESVAPAGVDQEIREAPREGRRGPVPFLQQSLLRFFLSCRWRLPLTLLGGEEGRILHGVQTALDHQSSACGGHGPFLSLTGLLLEDGDSRLKKESIFARFMSLIVIRFLTSDRARGRRNISDKRINPSFAINLSF